MMFVETDEDLLPMKPRLVVVSEPESDSRLEITISWRSPLEPRWKSQTFQLTRKGYEEFLVELTRIERNLAAFVWLIFFFLNCNRDGMRNAHFEHVPLALKDAFRSRVLSFSNAFAGKGNFAMQRSIRGQVRNISRWLAPKFQVS